MTSSANCVVTAGNTPDHGFKYFTPVSSFRHGRCNTGSAHRALRGLGVLTQCLPRGPRGANEPRAIAEPAGLDGDGS